MKSNAVIISALICIISIVVFYVLEKHRGQEDQLELVQKSIQNHLFIESHQQYILQILGEDLSYEEEEIYSDECSWIFSIPFSESEALSAINKMISTQEYKDIYREIRFAYGGSEVIGKQETVLNSSTIDKIANSLLKTSFKDYKHGDRLIYKGKKFQCVYGGHSAVGSYFYEFVSSTGSILVFTLIRTKKDSPNGCIYIAYFLK